MTKERNGDGFEVEPLPDWKPDSSWGFLGWAPASTKGWRLIRVADLIRWVQSTRGLPRRDAIEAVCEKIGPHVMTALYVLNDTDYAKPVPADCMFGWLNRAQAQTKQNETNQQAMEAAYHAYVAGGGQDGIKIDDARPYGYSESPPPDSFSESGSPALVKRLMADFGRATVSVRAKRQPEVQVDSLDDERSVVARLAITIEAAYELVSYGTVVERRAQLASGGGAVVQRPAPVVGLVEATAVQVEPVADSKPARKIGEKRVDIPEGDELLRYLAQPGMTIAKAERELGCHRATITRRRDEAKRLKQASAFNTGAKRA